MSILWVMSTPDKHVVGESKQIGTGFAQGFSTLVPFTYMSQNMHRSENSNKHECVFFLARSVCHPEEFTFLHLDFLGTTSILFFESSALAFRREISWQQVLLH